MLHMLVFTRLAMLGWAQLMLMPVELACESIETELERRGVHL